MDFDVPELTKTHKSRSKPGNEKVGSHLWEGTYHLNMVFREIQPYVPTACGLEGDLHLLSRYMRTLLVL